MPDTVANATKITRLATKTQKLVTSLDFEYIVPYLDVFCN